MPASRELFYYLPDDSVYHLFRDCDLLTGKKQKLRQSEMSEIDEFQQKWLEEHGSYLDMCLECRLRAALGNRTGVVERELPAELSLEDIPEDDLGKLLDTSGLEETGEDGDDVR